MLQTGTPVPVGSLCIPSVELTGELSVSTPLCLSESYSPGGETEAGGGVSGHAIAVATSPSARRAGRWHTHVHVGQQACMGRQVASELGGPGQWHSGRGAGGCWAQWHGAERQQVLARAMGRSQVYGKLPPLAFAERSLLPFGAGDALGLHGKP